jgi:hypothetical protein
MTTTEMKENEPLAVFVPSAEEVSGTAMEQLRLKINQRFHLQLCKHLINLPIYSCYFYSILFKAAFFSPNNLFLCLYIFV